MKPTSCLVGLLVFLFSAVADAQPSKSFDGSLEKKKGIQPIHKVPSEAAKRAELSGQVFVVTNGRDNIKLALVEVNVIAEDIFMQYVKTRNEYRDEQMEVLSAHIEPAAVKAAQAAEMECLVATEAWRAMSREINKMRRDIGDVNKIQINDLLNKSNLLTQEICNIAESLDLKKKIYYLHSAGYYFEKLPSAVAASKTDADGKFTIYLPTGKYVMAATTSRQVLRDKQQYYWLISVDVSSANQSLMLSNDNMLGTKCKECINLGSIP